MAFLILSLCLIWIIPYTLEIGITAHIEIAERTREHFAVISEGVDYSQLLNKHEDAFQAGAPYPDAYYSDLCEGGEYHYVSEDSHWTPFINATVNYIREVYPRPWNRTAEQLVVFLLSIVTHQVGDVNWHSLGIDQGFLTTMGKINYHGSYNDAHSDGDFGADVLNLFGLDMSYVGKIAKWYVPVDDLLNIYNVLYNGESPMTAEIIERCTTLLFLGRLGENIGVVDKLYPIYAQRSPFMTDRLQDYYLGGMDDMSVWSMNVWMHTVYMLDHGTEVCDLNENPIYITCDTVPMMQRAYSRYKRAVTNHPAYVTKQRRGKEIQNNIFEALGIQFTEADVKVKKTSHGVKLSPKKRLRRSVENIYEDYINKLPYDLWDEMEYEDSVTEPEGHYSTVEAYSRLGESLINTDLNYDGASDLVIGAPGFSSDNNIQQGRVYIVYGDAAGIPTYNMTIEEEANVTLNGSSDRPNGRFGHALASVDLNADGYRDLVVSAPSEGSHELNYNGRVYVYYGHSNGISSSAGLEIDCTYRYGNLGWTLSSADINNDGFDDLIVGSPFAPMGGEQRGFVGVLYASPTLADEDVITEEDFDWIFAGSQDYEWVGYSLNVEQISDGSKWLTVGAPTYRNCSMPDCAYSASDIQSVGRVYGFSSPLEATPSFIITGSEEFQQLGFSLHSGAFGNDHYLFVTSATADAEPDSANITQGGKVELFSWFNLIQGNVSVIASFNGDKAYSRFGFNVQTFDFDRNGELDLLITAALRSGSYFDYQESGRAFVFRANETFIGANTHEQAYKVLGLDTNRIRFGYASTFISSFTGSSLAFGIPHFSEHSRLGGGVVVYDL